MPQCILSAMPKITIAKTGQTFECEEGTTFLEASQQQDIPHEFGCTVGSCGTCACTIESGGENVEPASDDERETVEMCSDIEGARLGCQLVIRGDVTIRQA